MGGPPARTELCTLRTELFTQGINDNTDISSLGPIQALHPLFPSAQGWVCFSYSLVCFSPIQRGCVPLCPNTMGQLRIAW